MQGITKPSSYSVTQNAIPQYFKERYGNFVELYQQICEWLDSNKMPADVIRNLVEYRSIETTSTDILQLILNEYLDFIPATTTLDTRYVASRIFDFYKSKGTLPSYQFIMTQLFGVDISLEDSSQYVFRTSYATYSQSSAIYVQPTNTWNISEVTGAKVTNKLGSFAYIDSVSSVTINGSSAYKLILSQNSVIGDFSASNEIYILNNTIPRSYYYATKSLTVTSVYGTTLQATSSLSLDSSYVGLLLIDSNNNACTITGITSSLLQSNETYLITLDISSLVGTVSGTVYIVPTIYQNSFYTINSFYTGTLIPVYTNPTIVNTGSLTTNGQYYISSLYDGTIVDTSYMISSIGRGMLDTVKITSSGSGYQTGQSIYDESGNVIGTISAVNGSGFQANVRSTLNSAMIVSGGSGYSVGDTITVSGGSPLYPVTMSVASVQGSNTLTGFNIVSGGTGYSYANLALYNTSTNSIVTGVTLTPTITNTSITGISYSPLNYALPASTIGVIVNGYGAAATAVVTSGVITSVSGSSGGANYVNPVVNVISSYAPTIPAQFSLTVVSGVITNIALVSGGAGYPSSVTLQIVEAQGYGASISPVISTGTVGAVTSLTVTNNGVYSQLPLCFSTPYTTTSSGTGLSIDLDFKVHDVQVVNSGTGYINPSIIQDNIGSGASLIPTIVNGNVTAFYVQDSGINYTNNAAIQFNMDSSVTGFVAGSFIPHVDSLGRIYSVSIASEGTNYTTTVMSENRIELENASGYFLEESDTTDTEFITFDNLVDTVNITGMQSAVYQLNTGLKGQIVGFDIVNSGSGYLTTTPLNIKVNSSTGSGAIIIGQIINNSIANAYVLMRGSDYSSTDTISVTGVGSGANLSPVISNGQVVSVNVISGGSGYTSYGTSLYLIDSTGSGASLSPVISNGQIVDVTLNSSGNNYNESSIFIVGDGIDAEIVPIISRTNGINSVTVLNQGYGYVVQPELNLFDTSLINGVTGITLNNFNQYNSAQTINAGTSGNGKFSAFGYGVNVGSIESLIYTGNGDDTTIYSTIESPYGIVVDNAIGFIEGETISLKNQYGYVPDSSYSFLMEDGTDHILDEIGDYIWEEYYPYSYIPASATIYKIKDNVIYISNSDSDETYLTESGNELVMENDFQMADEISAKFIAGDMIIGSISQSSTRVEYYNQPVVVLSQSNLFTDIKEIVNQSGILSDPNSKLHNGYNIQDYAYEVHTSIPLSEYEHVLKNTVHPSGFLMYGVMENSNNVKLVPTTILEQSEYNSNQQLSYTINIALDNESDIVNTQSDLSLEYCIVSLNGTNPNTFTISGFSSNIPVESFSWVGSVVYAWDNSSGANAFVANKVMMEDGTDHILAESGQLIDTEDLYVYVLSYDSSLNQITTSMNINGTIASIQAYAIYTPATFPVNMNSINSSISRYTTPNIYSITAYANEAVADYAIADTGLTNYGFPA